MAGSRSSAERHVWEFNPDARCLCEADTVRTEKDSSLTARLTNEHKAITHNLRRLRARAEKIPVGESSREAMRFTRLVESLNEHFRKEEQLLFPILIRCLGSDICGRLKNENAKILGIAKRLRARTRPVKESFSNLERLIGTHISIEENVLFWYIDLQPQLS